MKFSALIVVLLLIVSRTRGSDQYPMQGVVTSTNASVTGSGGLVSTVTLSFKTKEFVLVDTGTAPLYVALTGTASATVYDLIANPVIGGQYFPVILQNPSVVTGTAGAQTASIFESGSSNFHWSQLLGP